MLSSITCVTQEEYSWKFKISLEPHTHTQTKLYLSRRQIVLNNLIDKNVILAVSLNKNWLKKKKTQQFNCCESYNVYNITHAIIIFKKERLAFYGRRLLKFKLFVINKHFFFVFLTKKN